MTGQRVPMEVLDLGTAIATIRAQRRALDEERDYLASDYLRAMIVLHEDGRLLDLRDAMLGFKNVYGGGWSKHVEQAGLPDLRAIERELLGACNDGDGRWRGTFPVERDALRPPKGTWVVYRLLRGVDLLYIGSTGSFLDRVKAHARDKDFDTWEAYRCRDERHCRGLEALLIDKYRPPLNRMIPTPKAVMA